MERVVAEFMLIIQEDNNRTRHPDGQTQDADHRLDLILSENPERNKQIILDHSLVSCQKYLCKGLLLDTQNLAFLWHAGGQHD